MRVDDSMTKAQILEKAAELADRFPELRELDERMRKEELIERFNQIVSEPDPADLYRELLEKLPDGVLALVGEFMVRITHPEIPGETWTLYATEGDPRAESLSLDQVVMRWRQPEDERVRPLEAAAPRLVPLKEVPEWARPKVVELMKRELVRVFPSRDVALEELAPSRVPQPGAILEDPVGTVRLGLSRRHGPMGGVLVETIGEFTSVEQKAAFNVLCGEVDGEGPLPRDYDASEVTEEEVEHVRRRVLRCLERPSRFADRASDGNFDKRVFFNQLLRLEFEGKTPPRTPGQRFGGTRAPVLRMLRQLIREHGYEVMGDYVVPASEPGQVREVYPSELFTQGRQAPLPFKAHIGMGIGR